MVTTRSSSGMKRDSVFSMVVLPEPDPPETTMFKRASTQPLRKSSMPVVRVSFFSRSSVESSFFPKRRMEITGPTSEIGGMTAHTREPSSRRASTMGDESSMRRPMFDTMRSMIMRTCA